MNPLVKKALTVVAAKEIFDRIQEARAPKKPSFGARLFKLTVIGGLIGGAVYAYRSGLFNGLRGRSSDDDYRGSMSYQGPTDYAGSSYAGSSDLSSEQAPSEGRGSETSGSEGERRDEVPSPTS